MFFRLTTERDDLVTIRDFRDVADVVGALSGYGLAPDEASLTAGLAGGAWSATARHDGADITVQVQTVARPSRTPTV